MDPVVLSLPKSYLLLLPDRLSELVRDSSLPQRDWNHPRKIPNFTAGQGILLGFDLVYFFDTHLEQLLQIPLDLRSVPLLSAHPIPERDNGQTRGNRGVI